MMSVITKQPAELNHSHSSLYSYNPVSDQPEPENNNRFTPKYNLCSSHRKDENICTTTSKESPIDKELDTVNSSSSFHVLNLNDPEIEKDHEPEPVIGKTEVNVTATDVNSAVSTFEENHESSRKNANDKKSSNIETPSYPVPLSGIKFNLNAVKVETPNSNNLLKTDEVRIKASQRHTSQISSQREKILKKRREERLSGEKVLDSRERQKKCLQLGSSSDVRKKSTMSAKSKNVSKEGHSKHKRLKKKKLDYGGFSDIFSEPLSVKGFYSDVSNMKRERKVPSKFIYFSKMEKYMSQGSKSKSEQIKKHKTKHKHSEYFTQKVKEKSKDKHKVDIKVEVKDEKDNTEMCYNEERKAFMKDGRKTSVRKQQINQRKSKCEERLHSSVSSKSSSPHSSLSPKSFKKSKILRDNNIHQHCLKRYYRLRSSNWNCSSNHALLMLKRKYNSLRLLFSREAVVCLKRLKPDDIKRLKPHNIAVTTETCTEKLVVKQECTDDLVNQNSAPYHSVFSVKPKEIKTEPTDLVDPRVMSLSKTLQSGNNGQIGLEKIFKSYSSKQIKSKNRSKSVSENQSVKKKNKPDWSKWREKLKEASNRMVERKKGGLVIEKNINRFQSVTTNPTPCANSILHFRIPLKSNCRGNQYEENSSPDIEGKENTTKIKETESNDNIKTKGDSLKSKKILSVDTLESSSKVLKEMTEELTIEEYETDSFVGYSINGYSIEISRDSPIDIPINTEETSVVNECFDEEEMNKILYGDCIEEVTLNCDTKSVQEHLNDTTDSLTVTSDIIPNLCAQEELCFRGSDFSDEIDISPPVLEKLARSADNSDNEINDSQTEHDEMKFEGNISDEGLNTCDDYVDKSFDVEGYCNDSVEYKKTENKNSESLPFVIKNICSLSETPEVSESDQRSNDEVNENVDYTIDQRNIDDVNDNETKSKTLLGNSEDLFACRNQQENSKKGEANDARLNLFEGFEIGLIQDNKTKSKTESTAEDIAGKLSSSLFDITDREGNEIVSKSKCNTEYLKSTDSVEQDINGSGNDQECENTHASKGETVPEILEFKGNENASDIITKESKTSWKEVKPNPGKFKSVFQRTVEDIDSESNEKRKDIDMESHDISEDDKVTSDVKKHGYNTVESVHVERVEAVTEAVTNNGIELTTAECDESGKETENGETLTNVTLEKINERENSRKGTGTELLGLGLTKQAENYIDQTNDVSSESSDPVSNTNARNICGDADVNVTELEHENPSEVITEKQVERSTEVEMKKKRKCSNRESFELEDWEWPVSCKEQSNENMELNEERLMRDFPNHNWLFNKYNISEVMLDSDSIKDASTKGKKQRKDDKDAAKKAADTKDAKVRRKSSNSTANILPNQRKQSTNKADTCSESQMLHKASRIVKGSSGSEHNSVKIKSKKIERQNSHVDHGVLLEKEMTPLISKDEQYALDQKKLSSKYQGKHGVDNLSDINVQQTEDKVIVSKLSNAYADKKCIFDSTCNNGTSETAAVDLSLKTIYSDIDFDKSVSDEILKSDADILHDSIHLQKEQKIQISTAILSRKSNETLVTNENGKTEGEVEKSKEMCSKPVENLVETLFGTVSDNDDGDDDDDDDDAEKKLEIDESAGLDDGPDIANQSALSESQHPATDEQIPKLSTPESALVSSPETAELNETDRIEKVKPEECEPGLSFIEPLNAVLSVVSSSGVLVELESEGKTVEPETVPSVATTKPALASRSKPGLADLSTVKSEASSISFRQRTKPPVQLVHPQVHKPPGKIKVESAVTSEIQTNGSSQTLERKEVSVSSAITEGLSPGIETSIATAEPQTLPSLNTTVSSTVGQPSTLPRNVATSQVPELVLSTLPQSSAHDVTTSTSANFANGMVIPIQPFLQNVSSSVPQGYLQTVPQLQPNIVQIQSQPIDPVFQQTSPVHIQNQLIPVTIYQAGNQTLISNYTLTNSDSGQMVSSQTTSVVQAQPVSFNMNQTQLSNNSIRAPICQPVHTGPPPLLILPKQTSIPALNQGNQSACIKTQLTPVSKSSYRKFPSKCRNSSPKKNTPSKRCKQETQKSCGYDLSVNSDNFQSGQAISCDQEQNNDHIKTIESVEEVDDEIKKQMEELDREIKRKEQEQEEMRRKKLELLEKMKNAKSSNKSKDEELHGSSSDGCEKEESVKEQTDERIKDQTEPSSTSFKASDLNSGKSSSDTENIQIERGRSCKDVVLSEVIDETNDDVFDSDMPIDLSSAIKSSQGVNLEGNLSVTVMDGVISIKESANKKDSLLTECSGVHETVCQIEAENEKDESELTCIDDGDSVLRDTYTNKSDGINYIEDIGLVNPFTGEYEINEDVEGVEYLDLSAKQNEVIEDKESEESKENGNQVSKDNPDDQNVEGSVISCQDRQKVVSEIHEGDTSKQSSSESEEPLALSSSNVSLIQPISTVNNDIQTSFLNSFTSSMTTVLSSSISTITVSVAQNSVTKTSGSTEVSESSVCTPEVSVLSVSTPCVTDESTRRLEEDKARHHNYIDDIEDAPLNLEKVKHGSHEKDSRPEKCLSTGIVNTDQRTPNLKQNTTIQNVVQSQKTLQAVNENSNADLQPLVLTKNHSKLQRHEREMDCQSQMNVTPMPALAVAASIPQTHVSSTKASVARGKVLKFHNVMPPQHQQASQNAYRQQTESSCLYKQNHRTNIESHHARGLLQRKLKEKVMEIKPAHFRSPTRKVQKGAKPMPAHCQKATSRETMKKMCKTPFIHPYIVQNTSPYICREYPIFLSPKEVDKQFPRLWETKPPRPAHSKRPFGIAGHLIVSSARKNRKRRVSGEMVSPQRYYSLPNTPTSPGAMPPRATSADYHRNFSPVQTHNDAQGQKGSTSTPVSTVKAVDHHGAQTGLPAPIRAHCRPKSLVSSEQFYETSVLRPPALLRNSRSQSQSQTTVKETSEIIDLTADIIPSPELNLGPAPTENPKSKEKAIQKELSHAVSKRQRLDPAETSPVERSNHAVKTNSVRSKQLMRQIAMMPPPPYVGRQRMPVLMQVPRDRTAFDQLQRMPLDRRVDNSQTLLEHNSGHTGMQRMQRQPDVMTAPEPQIRPQAWASQYAGLPQEARRPYGPRAVQPGLHVKELSPGNEHFIPSQDMAHLRGPSHQQMTYSPRGPMQSAGSLANSAAFRQPEQMIGNPRMQHPNNTPLNHVPVQGYQNQTQVHQLLQQPRTFTSQMMQRGETSPQMMQMQMGETSPQMMQTSPQMMQTSPQMMQTSPQMMQRSVTSPQIIQRRETSPQMIMSGNISPQVMQRRMSSQIIQNPSANGPMIQNPHGPVMHTSNVPMMHTGDINQKVMYPPSSNPPLMHAGNISPQMMNTTGMVAVDQRGQMLQNVSSAGSLHKPQIQMDSHLQGSALAAQSSLTPEQRFQRMQQVRAQHIRSQQLQNRNPANAFEPVARMQDVRNQHVNVDQTTRVIEAVTSPQQIPGYTTGIPHASSGNKCPPVQPSTYPQPMAVLENQMDQNIQPHPPHHGSETSNNGPSLYPTTLTQRQPIMLAPRPPQANFHQTSVQNNVPVIDTVQQNTFIRTPAFISSQNMQCPSSSVVVNAHQHGQNIQVQGHITNQTSSGMMVVPHGPQVQSQAYQPSQGPTNMTVIPGGQIVQCQTNSNLPSNRAHRIHDSNTGQFQNRNKNWQAPVQNMPSACSDQIAPNNLTRNIDPSTVHVAQPNPVSVAKSSSYQQYSSSTSDVTIDSHTTRLQPVHTSLHSKSTVSMTTNPIITQKADPSETVRTSVQQSGTGNTQRSHSNAQDRTKESRGELDGMVEEELPHLQQVHGECVMCGKYSLYLCSNCKKIWYCSPECQLTHWQTHANECEGKTG